MDLERWPGPAEYTPQITWDQLKFVTQVTYETYAKAFSEIAKAFTEIVPQVAAAVEPLKSVSVHDSPPAIDINVLRSASDQQRREYFLERQRLHPRNQGPYRQVPGRGFRRQP